MPDSVLQREARQTAKRKSRLFPFSNDSSDSDEVSRVMKNYALRFFLNEGGREEEWGEQEEQSAYNAAIDAEWEKMKEAWAKNCQPNSRKRPPGKKPEKRKMAPIPEQFTKLLKKDTDGDEEEEAEDGEGNEEG